MTTNNRPAALAGIKVLDLSRILAGPWCTQMLADLGADVVVENFKVGGLKQYGLDYESLQAINPRLIYCSITGFGQDGPYAERAGYDLMVQAMCGLMSITGHADDQPGGGPLKVGVAVIDVFTGLYASNAILAALYARDNPHTGTGQGQHIDTALLDVGMAVLANQSAGYLATGKAPQRAGNIHPSLAPYQDFASADGSVLLAIGNDGQFARFSQACAHPEWAQDPRFASNTARVQNRPALLAVMQPVMQSRNSADWIALLEDKAVPCGPINTIAQAFDDPQVRARGLRVELPRQAGDGIASVAGVANPMRLSATPVTYRSAPPTLGQHTDEVLHEMGLDEAAISALRSSQAI